MNKISNINSGEGVLIYDAPKAAAPNCECNFIALVACFIFEHIKLHSALLL